jgi:hypothetical protein
MDSKDSHKSIVSPLHVISPPQFAPSSIDASPRTPDSNFDAEKAPASEAIPPYSAFSPSRQWCIVLIVTAAGFFSPLTGAVYLPSLILFESVFHASSAVINASVSVYWAVFGIAPMFGATLSDYGGRKTIYVLSLAVFLISNTLLAALPPTIGGLFALRVFQVRTLIYLHRQLAQRCSTGNWIFYGNFDRCRDCSRRDGACETRFSNRFIPSRSTARATTWSTDRRSILA